MIDREQYQKFLDEVAEISQWGEIMALLSWDQETMMPEAALDCRAKQKTLLSGLMHDKFTSPRLGDLARKLEESHRRSGNSDPYVTANLREFLRSYDREVKVPKALVQELTDAETKGHAAWVTARQDDKFSEFAPHLKKILDLRKAESGHIDPKRNPYDVQLERYEVGLDSRFVRNLFDELKKELVPLLEKIKGSSKKPDKSVLSGFFPVEKQREFSLEVSKAMGFDFKRGRLDKSVHPFCSGFSPFDVRITTRFSEKNFSESLFGVIHETGHALYEQGLDSGHLHEPVESARSMGVHESQSLLWEKRVGLSREFWLHFFPMAKNVFAPAFDAVTFDTFYFAINRVEPSLIRVDADEVTYPLHVILRFELEQELFSGNLPVEDLPGAWNRKMKEYLGITPPDNRTGVLQDVHWSFALFGYFPTYNLGAIYASQIFAAAKTAIPDLPTRIAKGDLLSLKTWLNENLHRKGSLYLTDELIKQLTGQPITAQNHINVLKGKYGELYDL